ncbi:unnamed protein product [Chironomus riparius]|uniref:Uncharacterized protein n=1 Tax=Chironomus riparius TaxID=315576 RepID=A0A9N9RS81_9DIPT|nr:unnamed protein product [Chironomus riparius]
MSNTIQNNRPPSESIAFKEYFKLIYTNDSKTLIDEESKINCRILEFSHELSLREILGSISRLDPKKYENLLVFIIEDRNFELPRKNDHRVPRIVELIFEFLIEFSGIEKPLLLQLKSNVQNLTKVYFKDHNCSKFTDIKQKSISKSESFDDFASFIGFFKNNPRQDFEDLVIQKLPKIKNFELITKFLHTLDLPEDFYERLVLKCAAEGTKSDFLTAIDAKCDENGKITNYSAQSYLANLVKDTSILTTAIKSSNKEVTHYLMKHCTDLIQQLPFEHQVESTTAAFETQQLGVLFDLLQRSDFPFPKDFKPKLITDKRILKVVDDREQLSKAIAKEDKDEISRFIKNNPSIKFGYDINNESVMNNALRLKKFQSFFHLKSHGFRAIEFNHFSEKITDDKEKKELNKFARLQRIENVKISLADKHKAVMLLATRTFIYNRQDVNENEEEHRMKIKEWYMDIYKVKFGSQLLEAASQCENLKLVFDFECDSVENVDVSASSATLGSTYPVSKWIFVGAKSSESENRNQQIKGVIAHEICHYVMRLVYQNKENPYYKVDDEDCRRFDAIASAIELMLFPQEAVEEKDQAVDNNESEGQGKEDIQKNKIDDECAGIISTVYTCYDRKDFHPELIVRPVHIYAQFDDDDEYTVYLREKYKILFDFFEQVVIPEFEKFNLKQREKVKKFNEFVGVLSKIEGLNYELSSLKDITSLIDSHLIIITTNIPKLLLLNVYKQLDQTRKNMLEDQNVFISPAILKNSYIVQEFKAIVNQKVNLNIFIDCSIGVNSKVKSLIINESSNYIFIASNESYNKDIAVFKEIKQNVSEKVVNYEWKDLAVESQKSLLQMKVTFQNNSSSSLLELFSNENNANQQQTFEEFSNVIDEDLINSLINGVEVNVNTENNVAKDVDMLYIPRNFTKHRDQDEGSSEVLILKYSEQEMLADITNQNYVLISDIAGAGKSETVKNMLMTICDHYSKYWITYIDSRQYSIDEKSGSEDILKFLDENILKNKSKFEKNIFKRLYENGRVCLIFDELDKTSLNCQKILAEMFKTFDSNRGNKLWIITRDYCESGLRESLKLEVSYKLDDFGENHGTDLIASSWILNELDLSFNNQSRNDIINQIKCSPNFSKYQEKADIIVKKTLISRSNFFGSKLPQFYKIVAEIFKNDKILQINLTLLKLYAEYVKIQYEKWLLKLSHSMQSQNKQSKYHKLHQLIAMKISFPEDSNIFDFEEYGWTDEEIIECIFLIKIGDNFVFHYEIFLNYFVADYIVRILKKKGNKVSGDFCLYFIKVLSTPKFKEVRMFLNEAFIDASVVTCINRKMDSLRKKICERSDQFENLLLMFEENREQIVNFLISVFQKGNSENLCKILSNNITIFVMKSSQLKLKFQEFVNTVLNSDDLKKIISIVLSKICDSSLEIDVGKSILKVLESIKGKEYIKEALKFQDEEGNNLVHKFFIAHEGNDQNFQNFALFLETFLEKDEVIELMQLSNHTCMHTFSSKEFVEFSLNLFSGKFAHERQKYFITHKDKYSNNYIHYLLVNGEEDVIKFTSNKLKELLSREECQEILKTRGSLERNLLHKVAFHVNNINIHKILWNFYKDYFDSQEITEILKEVDNNGENIFYIAAKTSNFKILAFYIAEAEKFLPKDEIKLNFMTSKVATEVEQKLLQFYDSEEVQKHLTSKVHDKDELDRKDLKRNSSNGVLSNSNTDIVWNIIKNFFKCENFTHEFNRLARLESSEKLLSAYKNLDNFAMDLNKMEFHETLWELLLRIFNKEELKNLLICKNLNDINFMHALIANWTVDKVEFTLNQIKVNFNEEEMQEIINVKGPFERNLLQTALCESKDIEIFKTLWNTVRNSFESYETFLEFLCHSDSGENNMLILAVYFTTSEIFKFIIEQLEINLKLKEVKDFLYRLGFEHKSLLRAAAKNNTDIELHESLWKVIQKYFNSSEILKLIESTDESGNNFFFNTVFYNNKSIVEISLNEIKKMESKTIFKINKYLIHVNKKGNNILMTCVYSRNEDSLEFICNTLKKNLSSLDLKLLVCQTNISDGNILHIASLNASLNFHSILWTFLFHTFEYQDEFYSILYGKNINNYNFLHILIIYVQNEEIIEFVLRQMKIKLSNPQYKAIVIEKGKEGRNLLHLACKSPNFYKQRLIWNTLLEVCESNSDFLKIIKEVDIHGCNVIQCGARFSTQMVFDYFFEELELTFSNHEIKEILSTKDDENKNILQTAATYNLSRNLNVLLFETIEKYFNSDEIVDMMKNVDKNGNNLLFNLICCNKSDTVHSIWYSIMRHFLKSGEFFLKYLKFKNNDEDNILHILIKAKNVAKLKFLWVEIENIFKDLLCSYQFRDLINEKSTSSNLNIIYLAAKSDDIEFLETMWSLLLETFGNLEEIENFMFQEEGIEKNIFDIFRGFDKTDLVLLKMVNLLQDIASKTKSPERYKILWTASRKAFKNDKEFLEFLQEQKLLFNAFNMVLNFSTADVIQFTIEQFKEIAIPNQIKDILRQQNHRGQNLLQQSVVYRKPLEFYVHLWNIFLEYFKPIEILDIINNNDDPDNNLLFNAVRCKNMDIIKQTWNQIKNNLKNGENRNAQYIIQRIDKNILHYLINTKDENILNYLWKELEENCSKMFIIQFMNLFFDRISNDKQNVLQLTVFCNRIEFHKSFWKLLLNTFKNRENLIKLISQKDKNGNNFVHLLVMHANSKIMLEFIFNNIKDNVSAIEYQNILQSKGNCNKNLIQLAVCFSKEIENIELVIGSLKKYYYENFLQSKACEKLLKFFTKEDVQKNNVFHHAVCFSTSKIFTLLIEEFKKLSSDENLRMTLNKLGFAKQNLLQKAVVQNTSLEFHVNLWTIISMSDILEMINHVDEYGHNLILNAVKWNSKEIVEYTWENIKMFIDKKEDQAAYLEIVGHLDKNLRDLAFENLIDVISMRIYVQNLLMEYNDVFSDN